MAKQKLDNQHEQQLCEDMGCSPADMPEAMNDRKKWRERVRDIQHDDDDDDYNLLPKSVELKLCN